MALFCFTANTVSTTTANPTTAQELLDFVAQNLGITGLDSAVGLVVSETQPTVAQQSLSWLRVDELGNPLGIYRYYGTWKLVGSIASYGITGNRPPNPIDGQLYFDTTIGVMLVYDDDGWITASGTSGDIKLVAATTGAVALANNPGWSLNSALNTARSDLASDATVATVVSFLNNSSTNFLAPPSGYFWLTKD